jgi:hypothetical protein
MTLICFEYTHFGFSKVIKVRWCYSHFINMCLNYYLILAYRKSHFNIPFNIYIYILSNIFEGSILSNKDCYLQL